MVPKVQIHAASVFVDEGNHRGLERPLSAFEEGSKFWRLSAAIERRRVRLGTWLWSGKVRAQKQSFSVQSHSIHSQRRHFGLITISNME
jgi:hypothetical protein